jgi:dihydropteroate synthase
MGILNVTPDSFSDGGRFMDKARAVDHALAMVEAGAGMIDIGGESTRPGSTLVTEEEELERVLPLIEALALRTATPLSVDSSKATVIAAAIAAGACFVNDVRALQEPGALQAAAASGAGICLMHMRGEPATMQQAPHYENVVLEVRAFLAHRIEECINAGIQLDRIALDPGIGFGKTLEHNLALLARLQELRVHDRPLLVGVSRKALIGTITGRPPGQRIAGGTALAAAAVLAGASIVRVHDVAETVDAVRVAQALRRAGFKSGVD